MYCIYCGKKVVEHARYCNYCGQFIGNVIIEQDGFDPEDNMTVDVYAPVELLDDMEPFREVDDDINLVFSYGPVPGDADFTCSNKTS